MVELVVGLPGIFPSEFKMTSNILECSPVADYPVESFDRVRAVFFLKLPPKLISQLDIKLLAPMCHGGSADIEQTGNLRISQRLNLHFLSDKLLNA